MIVDSLELLYQLLETFQELFKESFFMLSLSQFCLSVLIVNENRKISNIRNEKKIKKSLATRKMVSICKRLKITFYFKLCKQTRLRNIYFLLSKPSRKNTGRRPSLIPKVSILLSNQLIPKSIPVVCFQNERHYLQINCNNNVCLNALSAIIIKFVSALNIKFQQEEFYLRSDEGRRRRRNLKSSSQVLLLDTALFLRGKRITWNFKIKKWLSEEDEVQDPPSQRSRQF